MKEVYSLQQGRDFLWCSVDKVLPNPKNPRKDPGVKSKEIQNIIKNKGWEEGITAYKRGIFYIILSGHRRWFAAKELGIKEVPIYLVNPPKSDAEELERLGSVQSGQVDWTPYEWCEYTYNMHKSLGNMSYTALAKKFNASHNIVAARIRVYQYFPRNEIENKLENGIFSVSFLENVRSWIERLKKYQPNLVEGLGEDMVRQIMLKKLENKLATSELRDDQFVVKASEDQILNFLVDSKKTLAECQKELEKKEDKVRIVNYKHNSRKLKLATKDISNINYRTRKEAKQLVKPLEELEKEIMEKKEHLKAIMNKELKLFSEVN